MNELIMRALSYVDDRWITEAMSDYETVKMKHFFQKERRKKYLCTAVCIAAAAFILSISLIWSIVHKNMNNHLDNHPLRPTLVETQSESESLLETKFEPESEITTEMHSETTAHQISINRDFTSITYGYAGNTFSISDSAMKDRLCSAIEALSLQEASDEDLANYESLTGSYLIEFDNGIICAFTSQYFYYSNGAQTEAPKLYRLLNSDDFDTIRRLVGGTHTMTRVKISHSKDKQFLLFAIFFLIIKLILMKDVTIYAITTAFADDQLMVHIAEKLLRLNWLGGYNHYTLAKGCFFPFFLAVGKFFHIDFISCVQIFYALSCYLFLRAIRPVICFQWTSYPFYLLMLFNPIMASSEVIQRVYLKQHHTCSGSSCFRWTIWLLFAISIW